MFLVRSFFLMGGRALAWFGVNMNKVLYRIRKNYF